MPRKPRAAAPPAAAETLAGPAAAAAPAVDRPFQQFNDAAAFFDFCRNYKDQRATCTYLYRQKPKVDFGRIGRKDKYIDKCVGPIDPAYIRKMFGWGEYLIKFNDSNRRPAEIASTEFSVLDPELEPILDPRTLVPCEENTAWLDRFRAKGLLAPEGAGAPAPAAAAPAVPLEPLLSKVGELADKVADSRAVDAGQQALLLEMFRTATAKPAINEVIQIAKLLQPDRNDRFAELLVEFMKERHTPAPAAVSSVTAVREVVEVAKELGLQPAGGGASGWADTIGQIAAAAKSALDLGLVLFGNRRPPVPAMPPGVVTHAGPAPSVVMPPPSLPGAAPSQLAQLPASMPAAAPPAAASVPLPPGGKSPAEFAQENPEMFMSMFGGMSPDIGRLLNVARQAVAALERGISGLDFAHALCTMSDDGRAMFGRLESLGLDGIMQYFSMLPADLVGRLNARFGVNAESALRQFLGDFLEYDPTAAFLEKSDDGAGDEEGAAS